jgi:RNA-directed DNA polymerase
LPVDEVVADLNEYLRGFAGYFRYGNSARSFGLLDEPAVERLALFLAKRHITPACKWLDFCTFGGGVAVGV